MNKVALEELIEMSHFAGERFDLVQAGGGNTSVKYGEDQMLIKASGYLLSEVSENRGYATVSLSGVLSILEDEQVLNSENKRIKDQTASQKLQGCILQGKDRPSIETYLHALLYRYTFHVHSVAVNLFTAHREWEAKMKEIYPRGLCVPYETPGIELALLMKARIKEYVDSYKELPKIIFLQNHGLIVSSDELKEIRVLTDEVITKAEEMAGLSFSRYRETNVISDCYNQAFQDNKMVYLSEDAVIYELLENMDLELIKKPFSPDGFVFCGYTLFQPEQIGAAEFLEYQSKYFEPPKIVYHQNRIYIIAQDLKKAKMMEDVFKNNLLIANSLGEDLIYLSEDEVEYLGNWEAEKYRQQRP
ncbi:MAG: class II aldolase/adducin family protein [Bacteroidota bacterium]